LNNLNKKWEKRLFGRGKETKTFLKWKKARLKIKHENKKQISSQDSSIIINLEKGYDEILNKFEEYEKRLKRIEKIIFNDKKEQLDGDISREQLLTIIRDVYNSTGKLMGDFVHISTMIEKIKQHTEWSTEKIHKELYNLYKKYKINLLPEKTSDDQPFIKDGKSYVWFKLVD